MSVEGCLLATNAPAADQHGNPHDSDYTIDAQPETQEIERRYRVERSLRSAIAAGDRGAVLCILTRSQETGLFLHRKPGDPLRVQKNLLVVMNTIARHGAEKGGLAPLVLHTISERFAVAIERCKDTGELRVLCRRMLLAYCDAVRAFGIGIRSAPIFRATRHILDHLDCPLRLEELAAIAKLSPAYLCRRFKRETGITISEFIRQKRVAVAKWHLSRSDRTITEIGAELGYEDANYFSRTFSRDTGLSPSEYRRRRWQTDFDGLPDA